MTISIHTAFECRTQATGSTTNGGGWVPGSSGTDWTQQNSAQYASTDGVTNGTTTITSATANWGTDVVGNLAYVAGGTGSISGNWYQITARNSATSITVDRSTGLTTGTGATVNIGGAVDLATAISIMNNAGNGTSSEYQCWIKNDGIYTTTAGFSLTTGGNFYGGGTANRFSGYTTTRGDGATAGNEAIIRLSTNSNLTAISVTTAQASYFENLIVDGNGLSGSNGIVGYCDVYNCKFINFAGFGVKTQTGYRMARCEVTGCTSAATAAVVANASSNNHIYACNIHDNACPGIAMVNGNSNYINVVGCMIFNNSGASSDGINGAPSWLIMENTIYNNGRHGIGYTTQAGNHPLVIRNILANNGGWGIDNVASTAQPPLFYFDGNAYYGNSSGDRTNLDATTAANGWNVGPYTNHYDVLHSALSTSPFVSTSAVATGTNLTVDSSNNLLVRPTAIRRKAATSACACESPPARAGPNRRSW